MRTNKTLRGIIFIMAFLGMGMLFGCGNKQNTSTSTTYEGSLASFTYHPGYSDMNGGYHGERLIKNEEGTWVIECDDREELGEPEIITTYAVDQTAVTEFEEFLKQKKVLALENRKDSDDFVTDYSEWNISFRFVNENDGKKEYEDHRIYQYKKYSDSDYKIISEIKERFRALRGEVISTREEEY